MKITKRWLEKHKACPEGLKWFTRTYPRGLNTENDDELKRWSKREYGIDSPKSWIVDTIVVLAGWHPTFDDCRSRCGYYVTPLVQELCNYLWIGSPTYFYFYLQQLPLKRLRKCLQQVARKMKKETTHG